MIIKWKVTMKSNSIKKKFLGSISMLLTALAFTGCEADKVYEEAPESIYSQVGVTAVTISARELFQDQKIYAVNWNRWVDNYINTVTIGGTAAFTYKNTSSSTVTLNDGKTVAPNEEVSIPASSWKEESCAEAPGGKLRVFDIYVVDHATYSTANKGYVFVGSKFNGEYELVNPENDRSQQIILPVRKNELIAGLTVETEMNYNKKVEPVNGSPTLGVPGDLPKANLRYLVRNISFRPEGVPEAQAMYELRITFLPGIRK